MKDARFTYREDDHGATGLSLAHLHSLELSAAAGERDGAGGARDDAGSRDNSGHYAVFRWKVIQERAVMARSPDPAEPEKHAKFQPEPVKLIRARTSDLKIEKSHPISDAYSTDNASHTREKRGIRRLASDKINVKSHTMMTKHKKTHFQISRPLNPWWTGGRL